MNTRQLTKLLVAAAWPLSATAGPLTSDFTVTSTDFATFGIGQLRGSGTGNLVVTGVSGPVQRAVLYWHGPTRSSSLTVNADVQLAGQAVAGINVGGLADSNCWMGFSNSQTYKADVTSLVTGNGSYALSNFIKPDADVNGAQLLVFYNDGNPSNNRDVIVFSGNDGNQYFPGPPEDPAGWAGTFTIPNYTSGTAWMHLVVTDGQDPGSGTDGDLSVGSWSQTATFSGNTVQLGTGEDQSGALWDSVRYDITSALSPGANTLPYALTNSLTDCISLVAAAFDVPAGAVAPAPSLTLTNPGTLPANTAPTYAGTVQNPGTASTVDLLITGLGYSETLQAPLLPGNSYSIAGARLVPGTYTVTATITGTTTSQTQTFTVVAASIGSVAPVPGLGMLALSLLAATMSALGLRRKA
ncbi:hypothetical protein CCO03_05205 [Comamonas serinivorans]|uniref:IPTL-CTERM protein sorting domain-containing protein n=1 Tax=Comamonas serinivorans TaxID=1082851 RepID=A0A1Y0EKI3_9BURK|nr:hypothetical protein [Comamonas serinivorans]ARU04153.1 hypothetical protein CCO03_05205 [Comamonas serinivorans]